jgi:hypothetical protein
MKAIRRSKGERIGKALTVKLMLVMTLAVMLFGVAGLGSVSAQTFKNGAISVSQHEYVGICKDTGGTPSRAGPRQVKCDYGDGYSSTCNFKTMKCEDTIPMIVPDQGQSPVVDTSGVIAPDRTSDTSQPTIIQPVQIAPAGGRDGSALDPIGQ